MSRGKFVYKDQESWDKMLAFYDRAIGNDDDKWVVRLGHW